jgi:hypothetical protein
MIKNSKSKIAIAISGALMTCLAMIAPAAAQSYPGSNGAGGYAPHYGAGPHRYYAGPYHHHGYGAGAVAGGLLAGAAIGAAVASRPPARVYVVPPAPPSVVYVRPPIVYAAPPAVLIYRQ